MLAYILIKAVTKGYNEISVQKLTFSHCYVSRFRLKRNFEGVAISHSASSQYQGRSAAAALARSFRTGFPTAFEHYIVHSDFTLLL